MYHISFKHASQVKFCKKYDTFFFQIMRDIEVEAKEGILNMFCIFFGASHSAKTKEHIVPQWLLKLTGNPNRSAYFGRDWLSPSLKQRIYS